MLQHNEQQVPEVLQQGQERMQMSWQENCIHCCRGFWVPVSVSAPGCKFAMLPCCKLSAACCLLPSTLWLPVKGHKISLNLAEATQATQSTEQLNRMNRFCCLLQMLHLVVGPRAVATNQGSITGKLILSKQTKKNHSSRRSRIPRSNSCALTDREVNVEAAGQDAFASQSLGGLQHQR